MDPDAEAPSAGQPARLKRSLSLPLLVLYGLGTTIGAGIYALTGRIAGGAGMYAPVAFLVAAVLAAFTAFSFAELSSRYPRSAGEAVYVAAGLGGRWLPAAVGLLVALSGCVSAATLANGFVGYWLELLAAPRALVIALFVLALALVAAWGITQSVLTAAVVTVVELGGLLLVVAGGSGALLDVPARLSELVPPLEAGAWGAILAASFLAFYAFLGFEDMVNVAEEVKGVQRTLPWAIVWTLGLTTGIYVLVALVSVLVIPPSELGASDAPLSLVWERTTGRSAGPISVVGVLAMTNGALIQVIMASRVLYGLADQGWLPASLAEVHRVTRTPLIATAVATAAVLGLALWLPLAPLARATSALVLAVFVLVNLALWRLKRIEPRPPEVRVVPTFVPAGGFAVSAAFLLIEAVRLLG